MKMTDGLAIFPCVVDGWVYYCPKSETGGFSRVSVESGEAQLLAKGFVQNYVIEDGWVYYIDGGDPYGVRRVRTDGTEDGMFYLTDVPVTTLDAANGRLALGLDKTYEEDGFILSKNIHVLEIAALENHFSFECGQSPSALGRTTTYFIIYGGDFVWEVLDKFGDPGKVG